MISIKMLLFEWVGGRGRGRGRGRGGTTEERKSTCGDDRESSSV